MLSSQFAPSGMATSIDMLASPTGTTNEDRLIAEKYAEIADKALSCFIGCIQARPPTTLALYPR